MHRNMPSVRKLPNYFKSMLEYFENSSLTQASLRILEALSENESEISVKMTSSLVPIYRGMNGQMHVLIHQLWPVTKGASLGHFNHHHLKISYLNPILVNLSFNLVTLSLRY